VISAAQFVCDCGKNAFSLYEVSLLKIDVMAVDGLRATTCEPPLGGSTFIAMVQAANLREGNDIAGRGKLYATGPRAVFAQRKMRSAVVMVLKIARQHAAQMALVEDDDVIQTFPADRTDETLRTGGSAKEIAAR
jgi:hypothetical protein